MKINDSHSVCNESKNEDILFSVLQLPTNIAFVICGAYLFCLTVHCTNCTTGNMLKYRNATEIQY